MAGVVDGEDLTAPPPRDAALLAVAIAGVSFSGPLMAATAAPALAIAFWRNAWGAGLTVASTVASTAARRDLSLRGVLIAAAAGVALALHFGTWVPSLTMTSVASATALVCAQPIFAGLIALWLGRRLPRIAWVGIVVAALGTAFVAGADLSVSARALGGDLLALAGGFAAAVYVTIGAAARSRMSTAAYTAVCYTTCAALLLIACAVGGVPVTGFPGNAWLKIALVTVCAQLLGHTLINVVLHTTSPTVVSLALLIETPGAALVAYVWLHQRPPWTALPGLLLLLGGLALVVRGRTVPADID
ncbi:MAG TPA: DMT family transporter [Jatrophihabitantaceae bacterium]|jgi:drug/metabolite transporter (DMT)-like permease